MTINLSRRLAYAKLMPKHLRALTEYAGREIDKADLLSLAETDEVAARVQARPREPRIVKTLPFASRTNESFTRFIRALHVAAPGPVQVWVRTTSDCGLLVLPSIAEFNFAFDYGIDANGVATLYSDNLENELLLDYFDERNERLLEVEVSGRAWLPIAASFFEEDG